MRKNNYDMYSLMNEIKNNQATSIASEGQVTRKIQEGMQSIQDGEKEVMLWVYLGRLVWKQEESDGLSWEGVLEEKIGNVYWEGSVETQSC